MHTDIYLSVVITCSVVCREVDAGCHFPATSNVSSASPNLPIPRVGVGVDLSAHAWSDSGNSCLLRTLMDLDELV